MFVTVSHFHPRIILVGTARRLTLRWSFFRRSAQVSRTDASCLTMVEGTVATNTLAYYNTNLIVSVKSFIVYAPGERERKLRKCQNVDKLISLKIDSFFLNIVITFGWKSININVTRINTLYKLLLQHGDRISNWNPMEQHTLKNVNNCWNTNI